MWQQYCKCCSGSFSLSLQVQIVLNSSNFCLPPSPSSHSFIQKLFFGFVVFLFFSHFCCCRQWTSKLIVDEPQPQSHAFSHKQTDTADRAEQMNQQVIMSSDKSQSWWSPWSNHHHRSSSTHWLATSNLYQHLSLLSLYTLISTAISISFILITLVSWVFDRRACKRSVIRDKTITPRLRVELCVRVTD